MSGAASFPPIDHAVQMVSRLPLVLRKPAISALLAALGEAVNTVDGLVIRLIDESLVETSAGAQLDQWGRIVGVSREGRNDTAYRAAIIQRARENNGSGTIPEMLASYKVQASAGTTEIFEHTGPGYTLVAIDTPEFSESAQRRIRDLLRSFSPAGVNMTLVYSESALPFAFGRGASGGFGAGVFSGIMPFSFVPPPPPDQLLLSGLDYSTHTYEGDTIVEIKGGFGFVQYTGPASDVPLAVVAGGGPGGYRQGGGGGAGGVIFNAEFSLPTTPLDVLIGVGGVVPPVEPPLEAKEDEAARGTNGLDTIFGALTAIGGGAGGARRRPRQGADGGSGGGGAGRFGDDPADANEGGSGVPGQGFDGGDGNPQLSNSGGGGGGAGEPGENAKDTSVSADNEAGDGGDGVDLSAHFGAAVGDDGWFGGGGGGACFTSTGVNPPGEGGRGGGGDGSDELDTDATPSQPNTGGGGGASVDGSQPGVGGSGVVLLRLPPTVTIVDEPGPGALVLSGLDFDTHTVGGDPVVEIKGGTGLVAWLGGSVDVPLAIVAGGGAGGFRQGGGGGAGGVLFDAEYTLAPGAYAVEVGDGGPISTEQAPGRPAGEGSEGGDGGDSRFGADVAIGGGGGASRNTPINGADGGSGGGGAGQPESTSLPPGQGGTGTAGQGNDGGKGNPQLSNSAGGGGGAGEAGGNAKDTSVGAENEAGDGGDGVDLSAHFGTAVGESGWFGGGGGGAAAGTFTPGDRFGEGGQGGGGDGSDDGDVAGENGQPNTGGGGGGNRAGGDNPPGNGGSGVILIRLPAGTTIIDADA